MVPPSSSVASSCAGGVVDGHEGVGADRRARGVHGQRAPGGRGEAVEVEVVGPVPRRWRAVRTVTQHPGGPDRARAVDDAWRWPSSSCPLSSAPGTRVDGAGVRSASLAQDPYPIVLTRPGAEAADRLGVRLGVVGADRAGRLLLVVDDGRRQPSGGRLPLRRAQLRRLGPLSGLLAEPGVPGRRSRPTVGRPGSRGTGLAPRARTDLACRRARPSARSGCRLPANAVPPP